MRDQLESLLDFDGENAAITVNNLDWTQSMSAIDFLRDLGKHFRMGTMLSKDIVARRLQSDRRHFLHRILLPDPASKRLPRIVPPVQLHVGAGGNDQWGNIVGGMELIRKVEGKSVHVLTNQLITKSDGTKFGKTEGGAVWLNPEMLSPYKFYQFWLNTADNDVIRMLKVFTFLPKERIEELEVEVAERAFAREAQRVLADEVTTWVHGAETTARVKDASAVLFGKKEPADVDAATLRDAVAELPSVKAELGASLQDVLVDLAFEKGRGAARRTIGAGGVSLNNQKVDDEERVLTEADVLAGGVILIRKGRKNMAVIHIG